MGTVLSSTMSLLGFGGKETPGPPCYLQQQPALDGAGAALSLGDLPCPKGVLPALAVWGGGLEETH